MAINTQELREANVGKRHGGGGIECNLKMGDILKKS